MVKIAIVGTTQISTSNELANVQTICAAILNKHTNPILMSGGAEGVDSIAEQFAKDMDIPYCIFKPEGIGWEYYKKRNMQIAKECDELYCITTPVKTEECYHHAQTMNHEKTAGCWTLREAKLLNKHTKLVIL